MADREFDMPWFPFWAADFANSRRVRVMTPEEVGCYILLLAHQWDSGPLPNDLTELAMLCNGASPNTVEAVLERCFNAVDGAFVNERLEEVREEQVEKRMQKVRAGRASARARKRSSKSKGSKKKERRSNGVPTDVERANQRTSNESESESEYRDRETTLTGDEPPEYPKPGALEKNGTGYDYPDEFEEAWSLYPDREGGNPKKAAYRAWRARVRAGAAPDDLKAGVERYSRYCDAKGMTGQQYVQRAATFFGPDEHWAEEWETSVPQDDPDADRSWVREIAAEAREFEHRQAS